MLSVLCQDGKIPFQNQTSSSFKCVPVWKNCIDQQVRKCLTCTSPHVRVSGFRNPGKFCLWNPESRALESRIQLKYPTKEWNLESKFDWKRLESSTRNPESMEWDPESKTVLYSLIWGDSIGLWTANYYFSFIYLAFHWSGAHIWRPLLMKFQLEDFLLLLTVSSY